MATKKSVDVYVFAEDGKVTVQRNVPKPDLDTMQKIVGGLIEFVYTATLAARQGVDVICNEEGLLCNLDYNPVASAVLGHDLVGPILVVDNRKDRTSSPFTVEVRVTEIG